MAASIQTALDTLLQELAEYADEHGASDGPLPGKPVWTKHTLHCAMKAFEDHLSGNKLPPPLWALWVRFLRATREKKSFGVLAGL